MVLLDHAEFPRDKACGDGLTQHSVDQLVEMGLGGLLARSHSVNSVILHTHGDLPRGGQIAPRTTGKIITRRELDASMVCQARLAGTAFRPGFTVRDLRMSSDFCKLHGTEGGRASAVKARFVIAADGARSVVARKAGLFQPESTSVGLAVRGYFHSVRPISPAFHIHIPLTLQGYDRRFAGYGWVFPVDDRTANVGVGFFPTRRLESTPNPRHVFEAFLAELDQTAEFADLRASEQPKGGLLISGYDPHQTYGQRIVLAGDAAGLIDPFTGEGIAAAIKSGRLAAEVIADTLGRGTAPDLRSYGEVLDAEFRERFRAGEHFLRNYAFTWRVIEATIGNEGRLFDSVRNAAFDLAGSGDRGFDIPAEWSLPISLPPLVSSGIEAAASKFAETLDKHNPFLWKLARSMVDFDMSLLRLALFFSHYASAGADLTDDVVSAAAAIEMCCVALDIHGSVVEANAGEGDGRHSENIKWANSFALMAGDCLFSETYAILARLDDYARVMVGQASSEFCAARLEQLRRAGCRAFNMRLQMQLCEQMSGGLVGLACGLGTHLSGALDPQVRNASAQGRQIGVAAQLLKDARSLLAMPDHDARDSLQEQIRTGATGYPLTWTFCQSGPGPQMAKFAGPEEMGTGELLVLLRSNGSLDATVNEAGDSLSRIQAELGSQPDAYETAVAPIVAMLAANAQAILPAEWRKVS